MKIISSLKLWILRRWDIISIFIYETPEPRKCFETVDERLWKPWRREKAFLRCTWCTWSEKRKSVLDGFRACSRKRGGGTYREAFSRWLLSSTGNAAGPPRDWPAVDGRFRYVERRSTAVRKGRAGQSSDLLREAEVDEEDLQGRGTGSFLSSRDGHNLPASRCFRFEAACASSANLKVIFEKILRVFERCLCHWPKQCRKYAYIE